uniref:Uncharacterized protein n=1 Tax=Tetradesmus obliquus TaxID=3088 RepID=A0A383V3D1_TETOB|eukprot:jgi/Sobl393_1/4557/SZX59443.1
MYSDNAVPSVATTAYVSNPQEGNMKGAAPQPVQGVPVVPRRAIQVSAVPDRGGCSCTAGWVLFGVGFVFPICWIVGAFLPLCAKNKNNRRAAIGSGVMIAVYAILLGVLLGIALSPGSCINQLGGEVCYNKFTGVCKLTSFGVTYAANCGSYRFN